jgi:hypothetical protein
MWGSPMDAYGLDGAVALTNGNYVIGSRVWDQPNLVVQDVGTWSWGNGFGAALGTVSAANSLVGSTANDQIAEMSFERKYIAKADGWLRPLGIAALEEADLISPPCILHPWPSQRFFVNPPRQELR